MIRRLHYFASDLGPDYGLSGDRVEADEADANLVSSRVTLGLHMPVLDIDRIPVTVVPSTTPGNYHLYIDKAMSWENYEKLLRVLAEVGIIEPGFASASIERGATFVRKPGVAKVSA